MEQILIFQIGLEQIGLEATKVHQITEPTEAVRVPGAAEYITGIINFRGDVIPVIDLRKRLGVKPGVKPEDQMTIIAEEAGRKLGLIVDRIIGLRQIKSTMVEYQPQLVATEFDKEFFKGIVRLEELPVLILDLKKLLLK